MQARRRTAGYHEPFPLTQGYKPRATTLPVQRQHLPKGAPMNLQNCVHPTATANDVIENYQNGKGCKENWTQKTAMTTPKLAELCQIKARFRLCIKKHLPCLKTIPFLLHSNFGHKAGSLPFPSSSEGNILCRNASGTCCLQSYSCELTLQNRSPR